MTLREMRENMVLNQLELSALSKIPQSTISRWESGKSMPSAKYIRKLAEAMGIPPIEVRRAALRSLEDAEARSA